MIRGAFIEIRNDDDHNLIRFGRSGPTTFELQIVEELTGRTQTIHSFEMSNAMRTQLINLMGAL